MPHRRGSFHEDWDNLLTRFAHRGTRAALQDQIEPLPRKKRLAPRDLRDVHRELFERSQR